ncbi:hypothetical protein RCH14_000143 [Massilia sp. MP_M2]|uniref:hypothetical protein n=1 Tax=Massilia sp. MP_M2 TaxID=3071713 RepID=UPI00319EBA2B
MNAATLHKIVSDAINENVFSNWRFYLLLICIGTLTSIIGAYLDGRLKMKGEIAATKSDFAEIQHQLAETTRLAKTVETAVVHNDWIAREGNVLKRT